MPTDIILLMWRAGSYPIVDGRLGNRQVIFLPEPASHFFRRPLLLTDKFKDPARTLGEMERLPGIFALRRLVFKTASRPSYTPLELELRLFSRDMVLTHTPIVSAMKLSERFFCSNTLIVYLCSEVNCLYIAIQN